MNTLDTIQNRRSIKQYDPNHRIPEADFTRLIEAAMLAPTSFNIQHWRFVRVSDRDLRGQLRDAAWDQAQVTDASELLVITGNINAWNDTPERYWQTPPRKCKRPWSPCCRTFTGAGNGCNATRPSAPAPWPRRTSCSPPKNSATTPAR
ncbi:hypothetical protein GCM10007392_47880 [Saccharospirillum salsuginis]|uniref:Nitroreductase domain-containing protein n=1 Tax=Saccharospirillum salsuginis TaxID=418750 RepID=A0A918KT86_9GAMM|nr:hypothetical protein GCM10007392_47880 [Saccharospirillum salsuginis]